MTLTFWGVRGGIPIAGPEAARIGGNTVCLDVAADDDAHHVVMDAGTGLVRLGKNLLAGPCGKGQGELHIFLTHTYWDHIQGFPYFIPAFIPGNRITFWGHSTSDRPLWDLLEGQMRAEYNPIFSLRNMGATIEVNEIVEDEVTFGPFHISMTTLPHRGTASLGYRVAEGERAVALLGDVHYETGLPDGLVSFARGAEMLVHDAGEANPEKMDACMALELARKAGVQRLLFTHYAPWQTDDEVLHLCDAARRAAGPSLKVDIAREGDRLVL